MLCSVCLLGGLPLLYIFLQRSRSEKVVFWFCVLCLHVCVKTPVLVHRFRCVFAYSSVCRSGFVCSHWNFHAYITSKNIKILKRHLVCWNSSVLWQIESLNSVLKQYYYPKFFGVGIALECISEQKDHYEVSQAWSEPLGAKVIHGVTLDSTATPAFMSQLQL